ncbi:Plasma-membrane choline transporter [Rhizoctonia solani]|uniref:Protein PNS1 n=1 Tax=Rhizoctonia solani TaxID=456999 RepID=A0A8H8SVD1_9AGAM|nr:Plasma-membrane choline transporter [Rhizoctonia solani]QRW18327.1 Plasma-membrane choline transporter [Rhizoctonia solani]
MPASFSTYASQFLSRSAVTNNESQPMFYSMAEGNESQFGLQDSTHSRRSAAELDDDGLPMLAGATTIFDNGENDDERESRTGDSEVDSRASTPQLPHGRARAPQLEVENPYLDEDELETIDDLMPPDSIPLIQSPPRSSLSLGTSGLFPTPRAAMSPPDPHFDSSSDEGSQASDSSEDLPLFPQSPALSQSYPHPTPPPPPTRRDQIDLGPSVTHIDLHESLLPRDGVERSVFTLPDPARTPYRKYNDPSHPKPDKLPASGHKPTTPFSTLTHTIPLLTLVVVLSSIFGYLYLILLRYFVKPVLTATALAAPLALLFAAVWAFGGSFMWDGDGVGETWGETVGLRLFSFLPLVVSVLLAGALYKRYKKLLRGVSAVSLSSSLILSYPPLLGLSVALLVAALVLSIPFLALIFRLLLVGAFERKGLDFTWKVKGWAWWMAVLVCAVWMWSWAVVRGILRASVAAVVASWYYAPPVAAPPLLQEATDTTRLALLRASGPALGSVCASALVLTLSRASSVFLRTVRRITTPAMLARAPIPLPPEAKAILINMIVSFGQAEVIGAILGWLSRFGDGEDVQILVGVSGDSVWGCARRVPRLVGARALGSTKRLGREYRLLANVQLATAIALGVFASIGGYIFAAHALGDPTYAPLAAALFGAGTTVSVRFCVGIVDDATDALFLCYCLDYEAGATPRKDVKEV